MICYPVYATHNPPIYTRYEPQVFSPKYFYNNITPPTAKPKVTSELSDLVGIDDNWLPERQVQTTDDPAEGILGEKSDLAKMTVGSLVYQIVHREQIKQDNLTSILYQEVDIDGQIMRLQDMSPDYIGSAGDKLKASFEMELLRLQQQKRAEEIECWRDISRIKQNLMEQLGGYREAARRVEMISAGLFGNTGYCGTKQDGCR